MVSAAAAAAVVVVVAVGSSALALALASNVKMSNVRIMIHEPGFFFPQGD